MSELDGQLDQPRITVEERIQGAADFMRQSGISAVFVEGTLNDGRNFEGISLVRDREELAEILFAEGNLMDADVEEIKRRLATTGLVNNVVRPVQKAAAAVYGEGSDLLDERFDRLPGM